MVCGNADQKCENGLIKNSNGKWVSNGYYMKPEEVMFLDKTFTTIFSTGNISFQEQSVVEFKADFFDSKRYFSIENYHENIRKICDFFAKNFYRYFNKGVNAKKKTHQVLYGNYFEPYLKKWTIEFQKRAKIEGKYDDNIDGCIGTKILSVLKYYGFIE